MIRATVDASGVVVEATLAPGSVAYVDRDWLPSTTGPVPCLLATAETKSGWFGLVASGCDSDHAAASLLLTVARDAAAAVADVPPASVMVNGCGLIAQRVLALVGGAYGGDRVPFGGSRPAAIVETTGDPSAIVDATRNVANLGTIVLAGETLGRRTDLNLYPDAHARGLVMVGVSPPRLLERESTTDRDEVVVDWCHDLLVRLRPGSLVPPNGAWFAIDQPSDP